MPDPWSQHKDYVGNMYRMANLAVRLIPDMTTIEALSVILTESICEGHGSAKRLFRKFNIETNEEGCKTMAERICSHYGR